MSKRRSRPSPKPVQPKPVAADPVRPGLWYQARALFLSAAPVVAMFFVARVALADHARGGGRSLERGPQLGALYHGVLISRARLALSMAVSVPRRLRMRAGRAMNLTQGSRVRGPEPGNFMGHRLSKIYTRTGDDGTTGLGDGTRAPKESARVEAYGTVDEANSTVGLVLSVAGLPAPVLECLTEVQHDLFDLGAELCIPGHRVITDADVTRLETTLDGFNDGLPALKEFILPGGGPAAAACHLARTVVRRAERRTLALARVEKVAPEVVRYLNRLSDLLFVLARVLARHERGGEVLWKRTRR